MTVIIASLFLPFQPQFEINASKVDTAALVELHQIKMANNMNALSNSALDSQTILTKKRTSSSHSSSPFPSLNPNTSSELIDAGTKKEISKQFAVTSGVSSKCFMDNLTGNGTSPINTAYNQAVSPVRGLFSTSLQNTSTDVIVHDNLDGLSPLSTVSSPLPELALNVSSANDTTAALLKNVNRSLFYQSVLNGSNSSVILDGNASYYTNKSGNTIITPKSRHIPDINSSAINLPIIKQQHHQSQLSIPVMRRLPKKSPNSGSPSYFKYSVNLEKSTSSILPKEDISGNSTDDTFSIEYEDDFEFNERHKHYVPEFGGYSNNARLNTSLRMGSTNIFQTAPWKIVPSIKGNGGLKNSVKTALSEGTIKDSVTWVGTIGIPTDSIPKNVLNNILQDLNKNYDSAAVLSDDITFKGAYKNFCKQILWPTMHYQIPDNPNSKAFEDHSWNYYQNLNQLFADKIISVYKDGDIIWIHDYHLMLVPGMVREKLPNAKIGFFLHISFPSSEVFRCFAQREKILRGILGTNFLGFQTDEYLRHFLQTCNRLLMTDVNENELKYKGRIISCKSIPIGIDAFYLNEQVRSDSVNQWRKLIREKWASKKIIVCRDQFDRIRGLKTKMLAFENFLKDNPEYIEKVVLIQICIRSYRDTELEREIMVIVDRINSLSSDISTCQPVVLLHQDLEFAQYLALNSEADLFWVNTMREGMNLTCHEFVVCSYDKNAPLLLSEFTGSAHVLKPDAFLINPWDTKQISKTLKKALELTKEDKKFRWKQMFKSIMNKDSDNWISTSLRDIVSSWEFNQERSKVFNLSHKQIYSEYASSKKRLFILKISEPPTPRLLAILSDLSANNIVYVINSFSRVMMERLYGRFPNIGMIAENGAFVSLNNSWYNIAEDVSWKNDIIKVIEDKTERLPGSYYKVSDSMIRFHTENAEDQDRVSGVVGEAITHVNTLFRDRGIHAYLYKNVVFVQQVGLALDATKFILNYYNAVGTTSQSSPIETPTESPLLSPSNSVLLPRTNSVSSLNSVGNSNGNVLLNRSRCNSRVDFICVSGSSSPILEPLFQYFNKLGKKGDVQFVYTIVYGNTSSTYAKEHVEGLNELFGIFGDVSKAH